MSSIFPLPSERLAWKVGKRSGMSFMQKKRHEELDEAEMRRKTIRESVQNTIDILENNFFLEDEDE